jgi:hypothetical protein
MKFSAYFLPCHILLYGTVLGDGNQLNLNRGVTPLFKLINLGQKIYQSAWKASMGIKEAFYGRLRLT